MSFSQNPMDRVLEQISEMVDKVKRGTLQPQRKLSKETMERLEYLILCTEWLCKLNEQTLSRLGISAEKLKTTVSDLERLPFRHRNLLERTASLKKEVDALQQELSRKAVIAKQKERTMGKKGKEGIARRKKFRPMGGRKDWNPL